MAKKKLKDKVRAKAKLRRKQKEHRSLTSFLLETCNDEARQTIQLKE